MAAVEGPVLPAVHEPATAWWLAKGQTGLPWVSSPGGLGANWGEGLPRLSPDSGKEASPEGGYRNLRGVELRRKGEGQKDPRGRGLPAGIPEAQPAAPGLKGG
jgi:hypothetical protein